MNVKRWAILLALAAGMLVLFSGCGLQDRFLAQNEPTPTNTRRPRPTFTPRPQATETPLPTDTVAPTDVPTDIPAPTQAPVKAKATAKPKATNPPPPPPQPTAIPPTAAPTKSPFAYRFVPWPNCNNLESDTCNIQNGGVKCENSGNHRLNAIVYQNPSPSSAIAGIKVRFSYTSNTGVPPTGDAFTGDDGKAEWNLSAPSDPASTNVGNWYAWVVDNSGKPLSPVSPAIPINDKKSGSPDVCWVGTVIFVGGQ